MHVLDLPLADVFRAIHILSRFGSLITQCCGFAVDALATLIIITAASTDPIVARVLGVAAGITLAVALNRTKLVTPHTRWLVNVMSIIAALLSLAIYALLLARNPVIQPVVALASSIIPALVFLLFGNMRFFR